MDENTTSRQNGTDRDALFTSPRDVYLFGSIAIGVGIGSAYTSLMYMYPDELRNPIIDVPVTTTTAVLAYLFLFIGAVVLYYGYRCEKAAETE